MDPEEVVDLYILYVTVRGPGQYKRVTSIVLCLGV